MNLRTDLIMSMVVYPYAMAPSPLKHSVKVLSLGD